MISDRRLITIFLLAAICLLPLACGIRVSISSDAGSISEEISASRNDGVKSSTAIGADSLSHFIEGSGSFKDSHSVSNKAGANARVSVDIRNAEKYSYDYYLSPDKASKSGPVMAGEELNVLNAKYIQASAKASNEKGYEADVSTVIRDPGNLASLIGYQNIAMASKDEAMASQIAEGASAPNGYILADSTAGFTQLKSKPLQFWEDEANGGVEIDYGSIEGYSDLASASANGVMASQQMVAAMGNQIQTKSQSESLTASLFQSLKKTDAKVGSTVEGTLAGYNGSAYASKDYAEAGQTGHVSGIFSSTALAGKERKTRNSNYPEYDFEMQAKKGAAGSSASGTLEFYVDDDDSSIGSIQGAVDASDSGDAVNVAPGTYYENVQIDKSLNVLGAGASDTIVDGQQAGSVFTIGRDNPNADVTLSGMTIQGGSGTPVVIDPDYIIRHGGGILNYGTVNIKGSIISGNTADLGGGIFNNAKATVNILGSTISENTASWGGGIYNEGIHTYYPESDISFHINGIVTVADSTISGNAAYNDGGGIWNAGIADVTGSKISGNSAGNSGGGIFNNAKATVNISGSIISENTASWGGGIYNEGIHTYYPESDISFHINGIVTVADSTISGNAAYNGGGGIWNAGIADVTGSKISGNSAGNSGGGISNFWGAKLNLLGSNISGNTAANVGGGISNEGITISIPGTDISSSALGITNVTNTTISKNIAYFYGGGIYNSGILNLNSGSIDNNTAYYVGGGIFNQYTITGNRDLVHDNVPDQIYGETINPGDGDPGNIHVDPVDEDPGNIHVDPVDGDPGNIHVDPVDEDPGNIHVDPVDEDPGNIHVDPVDGDPGNIHVDPVDGDPGNIHVDPGDGNVDP